MIRFGPASVSCRLSLIAAALWLGAVVPALAAWEPLWTLGAVNGDRWEFGSQSYAGNLAPTAASAATRDEDYLLAGSYPAPVGVLTQNEPLTNIDGRMDAYDSSTRIHFHLSAALLGKNPTNTSSPSWLLVPPTSMPPASSSIAGRPRCSSMPSIIVGSTFAAPGRIARCGLRTICIAATTDSSSSARPSTPPVSSRPRATTDPAR